VAFQGNGSHARFIVPLGDFVCCRDRHMVYSSVDYEGEKDLFRIELKFNKK
jgi:hypothetical protein